MTEKDAIKQLMRLWDHRKRYIMMAPNCYTQKDNECDVFAVRKSGYSDEFEVKLSRSDFRADAKKVVRWRRWKKEDQGWQERCEINPAFRYKHQALKDGLMTPNYFWFVMPTDLATQVLDELPPWAGLIAIKGTVQMVIRKPLRLHTNKLTERQKYKLAHKLSYRYWDMYLES